MIPRVNTAVLRTNIGRNIGKNLNSYIVKRSKSSGASFNWEDSFLIDETLTEDQKAIRDVAKEFSQERLLPRVVEGYRNEHFDKNIMKELGEVGLLGATISGYGCAGVDSISYGLVAREVERVDSGYRSALSVQSSLVMLPIFQFGTREQKEKYLPKLAKGELIGCFGLTEPNHGSNPNGMETVARPHPTKKNVYLLSGAKNWITNSPIADVLIVWAKLDGIIRGFIVDREIANKQTPGALETPAIKGKTGLRASITGIIQMDEVEVPGENLFPEIKGLKGPFTCLNSARYGIAWGVMGALEGALEHARKYALDRIQFNHPLGKFQLIQKKLAEASISIGYGLCAAHQIGKLKDEGKVRPEMISMIKKRNCDSALYHSRKLMEIFGGNAASDEYHIGRIAANLWVAQTYEGQSDIHALIIGRAITGENAFV